MECLLSWCEARILRDRISDTAVMAERFNDLWDGDEHGFDGKETLGAMIATLDGKAKDVEGFVEAIQTGRLPNPFDLMDTIQRLFKKNDQAFSAYAFSGILLCASFSGVAEGKVSMLRQGGPHRLSLDSLRRRLIGLGAVSVREAYQFIVEAMIVSQHLSTAVNRFDGRNQRLRLTIEETGLEALVAKPWEPTVTEDRLPTLLSLAAQAGLVIGNGDDTYAAL